MPSALETLVKILKLERQQGCKNNAVIGGLSSFSENWVQQARPQSRRPEQHVLVDELHALLRTYDAIENRSERQNTITYMLDRITGRAAMPPHYADKLAEYQAAVIPGVSTPPPPASQTEAPPPEAQPEATFVAAPPLERQRDKRDKRGKEREHTDDENTQSEPLREKPPRPERKPQAAPPASPPQKPNKKQKPTANKEPRANDSHEADEADNTPQESSYEPSDNFIATFTGQIDIPIEPRLSRPPRRVRRRLSPEEATDIQRGLESPVTNVKGVGPQMAKSLERLGIKTLGDLLFYLPRRHDDYTKLTPINKLRPDTVTTVIGTVRRAEVVAGKNNRKDFVMDVDDGTGLMTVRFFAQHYLVTQIRSGHQIVISGKTSLFLGRIQMTNPQWEHLDAENLHTVGIVPVYSLTEGLSPRALRRLMKNTVEYWADRLPDYVPESVLDRTELADLGWTIKNLHFPEGQDHLRFARERFVFDQLLLMQMAILARRREWQAEPADPLTVSDDFLDTFLSAAYPFPLTGAQRRAIEDIRRDIAQPRPMNRLLQGDVGSGKTAVAVAALAMALANGKQAALMSPTSILAEQHYRSLSRIFQNMPGEQKPVVALLTSVLTQGERESIYRGMADGSIDIVVGTHALIQEGVTFKDLAIAVIDEQHRFGVEQRGALRGKGKNPHLLIMTATPIPRTLALTLHADLDLSVMDEMPPGRIPIRTRIVYANEREERLYKFIEHQLNEGRQAFMVYPLVESSEKSEAGAATEAYEDLRHVFHRHRVGLLHGRMSPSEKDQVMRDFSEHKFDVLVTTSVAEVGVDIPNASVIAIEGANRFGLAQLHQFRGRVGRGQHASFCLLIPDTTTPEAMERLRAVEETTSGFDLAERDWQMRGAGDLLGTVQSGRSGFQLAELMSPHLVEMAQREARTLYEEDPLLEQTEHRLLAQRVQQLYNPVTDVS